MKKFWKKTEGFTLVELIVVIAILGILAGVGTVGYSGYIKKANMAADQQLVGAVANSLTLQAYSNINGDANGYVLLSKNGAKADEVGAAAMEAAFGSGWETSTKLTYEWPATSADFLSNMDPTLAGQIVNSSFLTGSTPTELLGEVSALTNTAFEFLAKKITNPNSLYNGMKGNFSSASDEEFNELCAKYGIKTKNTGTEASPSYVFDYTNEEQFQTQLSNFMVMAAAEDFANAANDTTGTYQASVASGLVLQYATYNAIANSKYADEATKTAYKNMSETFKNADSLTDVTDAMSDFATSSAFLATYEKYEADETIGDNDSAAIIDIMTTVGNAADIVTPEDIKTSGLYSTGTVANYFNSYIAAAGLAANMDAAALDALKAELAANPSSMAVYVSGMTVGCTAMDAYRPH